MIIAAKIAILVDVTVFTVRPTAWCRTQRAVDYVPDSRMR
ncbi:hypothetical protein LI90_1580 [Carbonactinospora thermoautotrophica]|uniref:Uncharacterized protein n=1 Tax=Carbonactinospora thermoautotrophica TaxID=1469144 RepID=A0A132MQ14_9ACTN|nr:hypothetical protein LI90_1580 [Carbonactinospora thermoautotrophica]